jgi:hypothetical protein
MNAIQAKKVIIKQLERRKIVSISYFVAIAIIMIISIIIDKMIHYDKYDDFKYVASIIGFGISVIIMFIQGFNNKIIKTNKFFCPNCDNLIHEESYWYCPYCKDANSYRHFLLPCLKCGREIGAYQCQHCKEIFDVNHNFNKNKIAVLNNPVGLLDILVPIVLEQQQSIEDKRLKKEKIEDLADDIHLSKLELEQTQINAQIDKFKNQKPPESDLEKLERELKEKIRKKEIFQEYELKKMALAIKQAVKTKQEKRRLRQEAINVLLQGRNYNDLNSVERKELDGLEDMLDSLFDEA